MSLKSKKILHHKLVSDRGFVRVVSGEKVAYVFIQGITFKL